MSKNAASTRVPALPAGTSLRWNCSQDTTCSPPPLLLSVHAPKISLYSFENSDASWLLLSPPRLLSCHAAPGQACSHLSRLNSDRKRASTCRAARSLISWGCATFLPNTSSPSTLPLSFPLSVSHTRAHTPSLLSLSQQFHVWFRRPCAPSVGRRTKRRARRLELRMWWWGGGGGVGVVCGWGGCR